MKQILFLIAVTISTLSIADSNTTSFSGPVNLCVCKDIWLKDGTLVPCAKADEVVSNPDGSVQGTCCWINGPVWLPNYKGCE